MDIKKSYALCLSCSTRENIAMWMLYGAELGKKGAMLKLYPSIMKELVEVDTIELGEFKKDGKFFGKYVLKNKKDFVAYLTDVVYTDPCRGEKVRLTEGGNYVTVDKSMLEDPEVFHKNYAWSYEKECRYVISLKEKWNVIAKKECLPNIRVKMSNSSIKKMSEDRLVRSPVYSGGATCGVSSVLSGGVDWNL